MEAKELLIADLEHFGEAIWRNEEVGEKRLSFFVSLVTAIGGGLVVIATAKGTDTVLFNNTAGVSILALLAIGLLSYLRMLQRNSVTDEYQRTLSYIRQRLVSLSEDLEEYDVPLRRETRRNKWFRGGYAETFAVLNGLLAAALLSLALETPAPTAAACGLALAALLWGCAGIRAKQ